MLIILSEVLGYVQATSKNQKNSTIQNDVVSIDLLCLLFRFIRLRIFDFYSAGIKIHDMNLTPWTLDSAT